MTRLDELILKIASLNPVKVTNTLQIFMAVFIGLFVLFFVFIGFMRIDVSIPVKISTQRSIDISKMYASVIKEEKEILIKSGRQHYHFKVQNYDHRYFDAIKVTLSTEIPDNIYNKGYTDNVRLVIDRPYVIALLFQTRNLTRKVIPPVK